MITITGIDQALSLFHRIQPKKDLKKSLKMAGEKILELSEPKLPVKDGILKSSGVVIEESDNVLVGYNSEYASYQHEGRRKDGTRIIRNRPAGGESFFLSSTIEHNQSQILAFIEEQIANQIKSRL
jgi:hypothetical protein